jgi:hypothetical protein
VKYDRPWLRAHVGFTVGSLSYTQTPLQKDPTPLFPEDVGLSAVTQGVTAEASAWLPMLPYVGVDVGVSSGHYTFPPQALCDRLGAINHEKNPDVPATGCDNYGDSTDWQTHVRALAAGRYFFNTGGNQFSVGARAGFTYSDLLGVEVDKTGRTIEITPLPVGAFGVGAEIGAEIGPKLFLHTDLLESLVGGPSHYDTEFNFTVGYALTKNFYLSAAYDLSARKGSLSRGTNVVGEIDDTTNSGTLSAGVQF